MRAVSRYGMRSRASGVHHMGMGVRKHGLGSFFKKIGQGFKKAAQGVKKGAQFITSDKVKNVVKDIRKKVAEHADLADMVVPGASKKIRDASNVLEQAGYGMRLRPLATGRRGRLYTRARSYRRRR